MSDKPRELWIRASDLKDDGFDFGDATFCRREPNPKIDDESDFLHSIRFVEHSSYLEVLKERDEHKVKLDEARTALIMLMNLQGCYCDDGIDECQCCYVRKRSKRAIEKIGMKDE